MYQDPAQFSAKIIRLRPIWIVGPRSTAEEIPSHLRVRSVAFVEISRARIMSDAPGAVLAPLITEEFDLLDLAEALVACGFSGTLVALSRPLPRAGLIVQEIKALCPGLDVRIAELPEAIRSLRPVGLR